MIRTFFAGMTAALAGFLAIPTAASAEGGCPAGQYPIGGQGAVGCAPIPQGAAQEPARWHTRFGALAFDPASGRVVGARMKRTADDAIAAAMDDCREEARGPCRSLGSYTNGCVVAMRPKTLKTVEPLVRYDASAGDAKAFLAGFCNDKRFTCEVVYSGCSKASWF